MAALAAAGASAASFTPATLAPVPTTVIPLVDANSTLALDSAFVSLFLAAPVKAGWPVLMSSRVLNSNLTDSNVYQFNWAMDGSSRVATNCVVEAAGTFTASGTCNQPIVEYTWTSAGIKTVNLTISARPKSSTDRLIPVLTILK
jgi:hypothetical protein